MELARELAFRPDTPTAPRLRALAFLLDTPGPPPELSEYEREIQTWSPEQVEAELARLTTADDDGPLVVVFVGIAILAGMLAAILPARRASKLNVLEALQYE